MQKFRKCSQYNTHECTAGSETHVHIQTLLSIVCFIYLLFCDVTDTYRTRFAEAKRGKNNRVKRIKMHSNVYGDTWRVSTRVRRRQDVYFADKSRENLRARLRKPRGREAVVTRAKLIARSGREYAMYRREMSAARRMGTYAVSDA